MSNTPMADAAAQTCMDTTSEWHGEWVPLEVARQLEHKLATAQLDAARYQYLRTINKREFCALVDDCLYQDLNFDAEVDRRRSTT